MLKKGLQPSDFSSASDLRMLPLISKEDLVKSPEAFLSTRFQKSECLELRTNGTTGQLGSIWHDRRSLILRMVYAGRERAVVTRLLKKGRDYRVLGFNYPGSSTEKIQRFYDRNLFLPGWARPDRVIASTTNTLPANLDLMNQYKPDIVVTYGGYLGTLFRYAVAHKKKIHKPQIAIYGADSLPEQSRQLIEDKLQIRILSVYNACEILNLGFMCELGKGFHLHSDVSVVSVIDKKGEPVKPGGCGEVIISNLVNRATVLLNYRLGDLAVLGKHRCECGRTFPLLESLEGRANDIIQLPDGHVVGPGLVWSMFVKRKEVQVYQVVQQGPSSFVIKVLPTERANMKALEKELKKEFQSLFGERARVSVVFVKALSATASGKFREVVAWKDQE
jgi:phenylacetate-CoA ligase